MLAAADAAAGGAEHLPAPASAEAAAGRELLPTPAPSRARWWVLFLTCLMSAMQCAQWSWPGPIAGSLQALYGLDAAAIQLLLNWGPIMYLATSLPYAWAMRRSPAGLRGAIFTGIALTAASALLRLACRGPGAGSQAALTVSLILNAAAGACHGIGDDALRAVVFAVGARDGDGRGRRVQRARFHDGLYCRADLEENVLGSKKKYVAFL